MKSAATALLLGLLLPTMAAADQEAAFRSARPVWPEGRQREMNLSVGFAAPIETPRSGRTLLRIAAASIYRVRVNGQFVACGPARGPHGFYRVDAWDITDKLATCENVVAVEVAGYNSNSYYLLDQPSFLQAEVTCGDRVLASTAGEGAQFAAGILDTRVQKVQRYSFQRPFIEVYRLTPGFDRWQREVSSPLPAVKLAVQPEKKLLERRVLYPTFTVRKPTRLGPHGTMQKLDKVPRLWKDRTW
jgi:alpha-L-rhamnosidase